MRTVTFAFLGVLTIALAGCIIDPEDLQTQPEEAIESGSGAEAEEEMLPLDPINLAQTGGVVVPKRLLENGVIEVGFEQAPLTLLVFTEYHCSYCREFEQDMMPRLMKGFLETEQLKIQTIPFALQKYDGSKEAQYALVCASYQEKGSAMQDLLFSERPTADMNVYARKLELDMDLFTTCMASPEVEAIVATQTVWAQGLGVDLVPTFFLKGEKMVGLPYYEDLRGKLKAMLTE